MRKIVQTIFLVIWISHGFAQNPSPEIISSSGETFINNVQLDWTLGESAITTIQNSSLQLTQGFHQPSFTITNLNELPKEIGEIKVFPNPTSDRIEMEFFFEENRKIKIQLINANSKLIWSTEINGSRIEQVKDIANLPNGNYFLNCLIDENQYSKTFKIQKIN